MKCSQSPAGITIFVCTSIFDFLSVLTGSVFLYSITSLMPFAIFYSRIISKALTKRIFHPHYLVMNNEHARVSRSRADARTASATGSDSRREMGPMQENGGTFGGKLGSFDRSKSHCNRFFPLLSQCPTAKQFPVP